MNRSLKLWLSVFVAGVISVSAAGVAGLAYIKSRSQVADIALRQVRAFDVLLKQQMDLKSQDLLMSLVLLISDPEVTGAFATGDRSRLQRRLLPTYESIRSQHDITQFHFHKPPATSFLRLHRPEQFGDDLSSFRSSLVEANSLQTNVLGLEVTRSGPGLKVIAPVQQDGVHVGTVELATTLPKLLEDVADSIEVHFAIGLRRDVWESANCSDLLTPLFEEEDLIFYDASDSFALRLLKAGKTSESAVVYSEGRAFVGRRSALKDFQGQPVGELAVYREISNEIAAVRSELSLTTLLVGALSLVAAAGIYLLLSRYLFSPLDRVIRVAKQIERGDIDISNPALTTDADMTFLEVRQLLEALESMSSYLQSIATLALQISQGDLRVEVMPVSEDDSLGTSLHGMVKNLQGMVGAVKDVSGQLELSADRVTAFGVQIERGTHDQVKAVNESGSAVREISGRIGSLAEGSQSLSGKVRRISSDAREIAESISQQADRSSQLIDLAQTVTNVTDQMKARTGVSRTRVARVESATRHAADLAKTGGHSMRRSLEEIDGLTRQMAEILSLLNGFTEQTSLIAINAEIEAARAGTAGQGFSVVASRVKELSDGTKNASLRVKGLIESIQSSTGTGVATAESVVAEFESAANEAANLVDELILTMRQQEEASEEVLASTAEIVRRIEDASRSLKLRAGDASSMADEVAGLDELSEGLTDLVQLHEESGRRLASSFRRIEAVAAENLQGGSELVVSSRDLRTGSERLLKISERFQL